MIKLTHVIPGKQVGNLKVKTTKKKETTSMDGDSC
jgi:hypothetical protein